MQNQDYDYQPTPRQQAKAPKRGLFWCHVCDANVVSPYGRCDRCRRKPKYRKLKKLTNAR